MPVHAELITAVRRTLADAADPVRAAAQQRYMKSAMPYRGLTSADLKVRMRALLTDERFRLADERSWDDTVRRLWDGAEYREERYAALAIAKDRRYRTWSTGHGAVPLYRHLVETGAWWDYVDDVAAHLLAPVLRAHHAETADVVRRWAQDEHLWVRRAAILSQLGAKAATDTALLTDCLDANLQGSRHGNEFFIRKAIGWALRDYAKTDSDWVKDLVADRGDRLSPLSRREALKHLAAKA
ncbi:DNA alkylation repair protein [Georgenia subflava]|uniref:DNA alkylation repair protein n=1 Tax=Georgenia subflava TaxID=1622177 RepID=A0A6N7EDZ9_9MICO|nr:DNA alkylation repair protein [Georgenia subflava]MPV36339.1 DNA alkylation repair protein [Georgenia subflava]